LHAAKAQVAAITAAAATINACAEAAAATLAMLEAITASPLPNDPTRRGPPRSEAEADFFGKVRDTQQPPGAPGA